VHGQREIAIAVRLRASESAAEVRAKLERLLATIGNYAQQGKLVGPGDWTEFGGPGFLDSPTRGLVYADARGVDPEIPATALVAVLVDSEELRLAQTTSVTRVLSRLGAATRQYPFPATCDRDRKSVAHREDQRSMLAMVARVRMPEVALLLANGVLVVRCRPKARHTFAEVFAQLAPDAAFGLICSPEAAANGCLVWHPGQTAPAAITPPGSAGEFLTGAMLLVAPGVDEDRVTVQEDGFALLARAETWAAMREALLAGSEVQLPPTSDGFGLRVEQIDEGWNRYEPAGGARGSEQIVLLTPESEIQAAIAVDRLSAYIRRLIDAIADVEGVAIRVELLPNQEPRMASRGELPDSVRDRLFGVDAPAVGGPVVFEIHKPAEQRRGAGTQ
jgi:hypothetical protein